MDAYVYMMANYTNSVLYIGVTNNLIRRVAEHKAHINEGFTDKYNCKKLVYFEEFDSIEEAIEREKQLKNWKREWKNSLVNEQNPDWNDRSADIGVTEEIVNSVVEYYKELRNSENVITDCGSGPQ